MRKENIVKDPIFEEAAEVRADSKNRITLGKKGWKVRANIYKVYINALGQIILDPQATIPAYEQWLFKNQEAKQMVMRGLEDARKGRLVDQPEDFSKYAHNDEA